VRFFTRGWASGELPDDEYEETVRAYSAHLKTISAVLPDQVVVLAREVNLHDAVIERAEWAPAENRLALRLVTGPASVKGSQSLSLTYSGAMLGERPLETLRAAARDRATEILYSEVDCDEQGVLMHRLLFWPRDELTIAFRSLSLEVHDRDDDRVHLGPFFLDVHPEGDR
jgi:hypothetical protein